jgi:hypothetical protein
VEHKRYRETSQCGEKQEELVAFAHQLHGGGDFVRQRGGTQVEQAANARVEEQ